jgi:hypothetical protein
LWQRKIQYSNNGDPAFKNYVTLAQPNITEKLSASMPLHQLHTGHQDYHKTRTYVRYFDCPNINVWEEFYNGATTVHHFRNPYVSDVPVGGTDGFQFTPDLSTEESIRYFDQFAMRPISFMYKQELLHGSLSTFKFVLDEALFANPGVFFDPFSCPAMNISSVHETPLYLALPQYSGCKWPM